MVLGEPFGESNTNSNGEAVALRVGGREESESESGMRRRENGEARHWH